jgi:hypothetical protein
MSESVTTTATASAPATSTPSATPSTTQTAQASTPAGFGAPAKTGETTSEGAKTTETNPQPKRYVDSPEEETYVKVKINGKEEEVSLKELKKAHGLEKTARQRLEEAAKFQKDYQKHQQLIQALKNGDQNALEHVLGEKFDSLAEERLARKYELAQMDPVQRENLELKQHLEQQRRLEFESKRSVIDEIKQLSDKVPDGLEKYSKEDLAQYRDHLNNIHTQAQSSLQQELIQAWEQTGLPKDKRWGVMIAREMMMSEKSETGPLQAADAAAKVKSDWLNFSRHIYAQMDASAIQEALGKEVIEKLREYDIQKATGQAANGLAQHQGPAQTASQPKKYLNQMEYRQAMGLD